MTAEQQKSMGSVLWSPKIALAGTVPLKRRASIGTAMPVMRRDEKSKRTLADLRAAAEDVDLLEHYAEDNYAMVMGVLA